MSEPGGVLGAIPIPTEELIDSAAVVPAAHWTSGQPTATSRYRCRAAKPRELFSEWAWHSFRIPSFTLHALAIDELPSGRTLFERRCVLPGWAYQDAVAVAPQGDRAFALLDIDDIYPDGYPERAENTVFKHRLECWDLPQQSRRGWRIALCAAVPSMWLLTRWRDRAR